MYQHLCITFTFLCLSLSTSLFAQDLLKPGDVNRIMNQILGEHVDKTKISETIIQTAIDNYIDQFDPDRIYFLQSEVKPFATLTNTELKHAIEQYQKQQFNEFEALNTAITEAIIRSRKLRKEIDPQTIQSFFHFNKDISALPLPYPSNSLFSQTLDELKTRLEIHLKEYIERQKAQFGQTMTAEKKERMLQGYEIKLREFENQYLYQTSNGKQLPKAEQDNLFYMHILKALASSLDSHTSFYQANEAFDLRLRLQKEFKGLGLVLKESDGNVIVTRLIEKSPAAEIGLIKPGDKLLEIDGKATADMPFDAVMDELHGETDTLVKLTFKRIKPNSAQNETFTVELKRVLIVLNNDRVDVSSEKVGDGIIGKITLHSFYQGDDISSEKDVKEAIRQLEKQGKLKGLILDLRDNSGGFLSQAVKVAGLFITNGVIVISKYANGDERFYRDVDGKVSFDGPLIVLTSKATASAAEIVAQALQDYGVALIVGDERTYGKGTIQTQTVTDNQSSSYFKVTVGMYYTVSGHTPQKEGVKADIVVPGQWSDQHIGEIYMDSVSPDLIAPSYQDQLTGVPQEAKAWYLQYYTPTLQHKISHWREQLPTLRKNSAYRIAHNKNYQFFLKGLRKVPAGSSELVNDSQADDDSDEETLSSLQNAGVDDLQMQEAINIVKDMIIMHDADKTIAKKET